MHADRIGHLLPGFDSHIVVVTTGVGAADEKALVENFGRVAGAPQTLEFGWCRKLCV